MLVRSKQSEMKLHWFVAAVFYGLKTVGLAPFSHRVIKKPGKNFGVSSFSYSRIGLAYNLFLLILFNCICVLAYPILSRKFDPRQPRTSNLINIAMNLCATFSVDVIVIYLTVRQGKAVRSMNRLLEIDGLLYDVEKQSLFDRRTFAVLSVHIALGSFGWIGYRTTSFFLAITEVMGWLYFGLSYLMVFLFIVMYSFVVGLIVRELERVNKNLSRLKEPPNISSRLVQVSNFSTKARLAEAKQLLAIRAALYEATREVEAFFSFPILVSVTCYFCRLIASAYAFSLNILDPHKRWLPITAFYDSMAVLVIMFPLVVLSSTVNKAVTQARLTGWIVHKLLASPNMRELKVELREFSLQLLHEHVSFTGCDIFSLDSPMLHSIADSVAYYLVVILQSGM